MARVYLQRVGHMKVHVHRPVQDRVKTISLKREGRRWYVVLSCDDVPAAPLAPAGREIGLDVGVARFAATSDGEIIANPRFARASAGELAAARQALARKKRGSANRRRAKANLAEVNRRNRRADFHHKITRALVRQCDVIALEDLRSANMTRSASGARCTRPQQDTVICPAHGAMDADVNAAINIYARAGLGSHRAHAA